MPIAEVLASQLPESGRVLEVASGSGQHCAVFAQTHGGLTWLPSDPNPEHRSSVDDWCAGLENVESALALDCQQRPWDVAGPLAAVLAINLIHISPWTVTQALFAEAGRLLSTDGLIFLYGAYFCADVETAPSNLAFDQYLRQQNPSWGVRRLEDVREIAEKHGLTLAERVAMPANNLSLVFKRVQS